MDFIDLKPQFQKHEAAIRERIERVLAHGRFIMGPEVAELESALAEYTGAKHAITVASGTDSLEIALRALGVGHGDEVVTVPFTWISTAEVILQIGAKPVFVDIDPLDYNIAVDQIESAITSRTKALLPVSLFGQMPNYAAINAIAAKHSLPVIEDAAQSFGATRHGVKSCNATLLASTSFYPAKPLGCYGDGGALFTSDDDLAHKMRAIRNHGGIRRHYHDFVGMNGRFDTIQAAIMLGKWPGFPAEVEARARIGARYTEALRDVCQTPAIREGNTHVYAQYTIRVPDRDALAAKLESAGIPTAVYYPKCLHEQPVFAHLGHKFGEFPNSESASREVISLPLNPHLAEPDQDRIIAAVRSALS
jgi:UDP-2-acetamido-2-deoxy-ribo-hexuluronate aminotransferase